MKCIFTFLILFSGLAFADEVKVKIILSPAGSFVAKTSEVDGQVKISGDKVSAQNIKVNLKSLKTGISLRDKHTQKHLETDKFQYATLSLGQGADGKGTGKINIKGIEKDISGTYKISGNKVIAKFKLQLSDFKIEGIRYMGVGVKDTVELEVAMDSKP